jgi:hypothetical protein
LHPFVVFNLFVSVIVSNIEQAHADDDDGDAAVRKRILADLADFRSRLPSPPRALKIAFGSVLINGRRTD